MGTRGLFGIIIDNQVKAMYNHFDSYPTGLGKEFVVQVAGLIQRKEVDWKQKAREMVNIRGRGVAPDDVAKWEKYKDLSVSNQSDFGWYCLMRGAQGQLQPHLEIGQYEDHTPFAGNSLFCEWGYLWNMEDDTVEVFKGFQEKPHTQGRFYHLPKDNGYYPIRQVATLKIHNPEGDITQLDPLMKRLEEIEEGFDDEE